MSLHVPIRPAWTCATCGDEWPCHTRRHQLLARYAGAPAGLDAYLRDQLAVAMADQPARRRELAERFLAWVPPRPAVGVAPRVR